MNRPFLVFLLDTLYEVTAFVAVTPLVVLGIAWAWGLLRRGFG